MALTIATGFVVDDAIVMVENIARYLEHGDPPLHAALKSAGEIGFTILSLTVSLIAVLIPLLFMENVVGRLFREFAVTLAVPILISAVVSLTLAPMLAAKIMTRPESHDETSPGFQKLIGAYERLLDLVLRHQSATLAAFGVTVVACNCNAKKRPPEEAIFSACLLRFRPILVTTLAALFGAVTLILGAGEGSELRIPLGVSIIGGLVFSQALTLFSTPAIYLAFDRMANRHSRMTARANAPVAVAPCA